MRLIASLTACLVLCGALARTGMSANCGAPPAMSDGWAVSAPEQQGLDPQLICSIGSVLAKLTEADPHGVVAIRHRVLIYEQYFTGKGMRGWTSLGVVAHDANTLEVVFRPRD